MQEISRQKPELLAPAGTPEKARVAFLYGADAVYLAGTRMGLRQAAGNFNYSELSEIISFSRKCGKKVYVTVNAFAFDSDFAGLEEYLRELDSLRPHGLIISDAGVFALAKRITSIPLHVSTQASITSSQGVWFWARAGASRVILARELCVEELRSVCAASPVELEVFIHGSMCVSYSGKCVISNYSAGRDANRGGCVHSCRYIYELENAGKNAALMNSRDMLGLDVVPDLIDMGMHSFKIEGRMKSALYLANTVSVYRRMIDACLDGRPVSADFTAGLRKELDGVRNRGFAGFPEPGFAGFIDRRGEQDMGSSSFCAVVRAVDESKGILLHVRSDFELGTKLGFLLPGGGTKIIRADTITDISGQSLDLARADSMVFVPFDEEVTEWTAVCVERGEGAE